MTSTTTKPAFVQREAETSVYVFDNWFDPIEAGLRDRVREFIHFLIEGEPDQRCRGGTGGAQGLKPEGGIKSPWR